MSAVKVGGQCEGYGGIFRALQQLLPVEHAWYAEVDENASKVLAHHYPGVPNHGDITRPNGTGPYGLPRRRLTAPRRPRQAAKRHARRVQGWRDMAEPVDIFTSGFPCTDISLAGKKQGSKGKNFLWSTGVIPAVEALRPPLAVFENVPNLLRIENGQVLARVLADLDELGYTVSWTTVGACKVGACHHRHRVFIAATLVKVRQPMSDPIAHCTGGGWMPAQSVLFGDAGAVRWPASGFTSGGTAWELPVETCVTGGDWLFPAPRVSDTTGAGVRGNGGMDLRTAVAMLPTPRASDTGTPGRRASEGWRPPLSQVLLDMLPTPTVNSGVRGEAYNNRGEPLLSAAVLPERFGKYAAAVHRHEVAFDLPVPAPTEPGRDGKARLSAAFPEWMMGLPAGWLTDVLDRGAAIARAGNGVNSRQAAYALSTLPTFRAAVADLTAGELVAA